MAVEILMPALSPTMTEGNLAKWLKKEGDKIKPGEVLAEIETDKATMEVEAVDAGILGKIIVPAQSHGVKVNQLIAVILESGDDKNAIDAIIKKFADQPKAAVPEAKKVETHVAKPEVISAQANNRIFATPLAKKVASMQGVNLNQIQGSGPKGRIVKDDVLNTKSTGKQIGRNQQEYSVVPVSTMRKVIAKRLMESKQTIPHFYLTVDCNVDELLKFREAVNNNAPQKDGVPAYKVSLNDIIIKASATALARKPEANCSWSDDAILQYNNVDIAVAVAIPDGLITPIVRNADQKSLTQVSVEIKELAARARQNGLRSEEFQGGSFSISNLGMYGIKQFNAIINPPQACILSVGAVEKRVIAVGDAVRVASVLTVSISCDHRVIDGAIGAELLGLIKQYLEQPVMMYV
ncbi:MAG: pyruvate dehydrogenase complex dihydrolipoamide acetyltransferase [Rickettsiales bacterium]